MNLIPDWFRPVNRAEFVGVLHDIGDRIEAAEQNITSMGELMATDRDLIQKIAAALPVLADAVRAKDAEIARLRTEASEDEAADTAALSPVAEAIDALVAAASPAAPDVTPVDTVEDVPGSLEDAPAEEPPVQ